MCRNANGVIHVHHRKLWEKLITLFPCTDPMVPYGTPEMASEIQRLIRKHKYFDQGLIVMGGHEEGLLAYGPTLQTAADLLIREYSLLLPE